MGLSIRNRETVAPARELARLKGQGITETIHKALERERRETAPREVSPEEIERRNAALDALLAEIAKLPRTGLVAEKAFYDSVYED
jgi:antitoxin VapB